MAYRKIMIRDHSNYLCCIFLICQDPFHITCAMVWFAAMPASTHRSGDHGCEHSEWLQELLDYNRQQSQQEIVSSLHGGLYIYEIFFIDI